MKNEGRRIGGKKTGLRKVFDEGFVLISRYFCPLLLNQPKVREFNILSGFSIPILAGCLFKFNFVQKGVKP